MKIDYNKLYFEPEEIYLEMKKMGLYFELEEEYRFLETNNSSLKENSFSLFSTIENIENKEKYIENLILSKRLYESYKLNTRYSFRENNDSEEEYVEYQKSNKKIPLTNDDKSEQYGRLMMGI